MKRPSETKPCGRLSPDGEGGRFPCELPKGHEGSHSCGFYEWPKSDRERFKARRS